MIAPAVVTDAATEIRRLSREAKAPAIASNLALAGEYHAQISRLREQVKQAQAGAR